jgi:MerR family transcriptional regulator, thiopeptide resistance regulator
MEGADGRRKIGELARETGLTVRTLHHYDQLGLLSPRSRTEGGHRCYTREDVGRLHRIVALRSLGISLEEIGGLLDGGEDLADLLRRQLVVIDERVRLALDLRARITELLGGLDRNAGPSAGQLAQLIEETVRMNEPLTPEALAELTAARQHAMSELSEEELSAMRQRRDQAWQALSRQEQEHLIAQRRAMMPGGGA